MRSTGKLVLINDRTKEQFTYNVVSIGEYISLEDSEEKWEFELRDIINEKKLKERKRKLESELDEIADKLDKLN